jgi:hypothetical protein
MTFRSAEPQEIVTQSRPKQQRVEAKLRGDDDNAKRELVAKLTRTNNGYAKNNNNEK